LPADVAAFTGRSAELAQLDALLDGAGVGEPVVISAVSGTAGVGNTALAVHWTHRVRDRFPDGQLYVNLRGYDPDQPMTAEDALAQFLDALGVAGQDMPLDVDQRAARYRSETRRYRQQAQGAFDTWIVDFYNTRRRHSACAGMSPIDYERFMAEAKTAEAA
jgi:hypothetical protein